MIIEIVNEITYNLWFFFMYSIKLLPFPLFSSNRCGGEVPCQAVVTMAIFADTSAIINDWIMKSDFDIKIKRNVKKETIIARKAPARVTVHT